VETADPEITGGTGTKALIEKVAGAVCRRGMALPAVFLLEAHKPLSRLVHSAAQLSQPLLGTLCGASFTAGLLRLLESPYHVELLIREIEKQNSQVVEAHARRGPV